MKILTLRINNINRFIIGIITIANCHILSAASLEDNDLDLFRGGLHSLSTSDEFSMRTAFVDYVNHRRETVWPYQENVEHGIDWGVSALDNKGKSYDTDFHGIEAKVMIGKYILPSTYIKAELGAHDLQQVNTNESETTPVYTLSARIVPIDELILGIEANKDYLYQYAVHPGGVTNFLTSNNYIGSFQWRPVEKLRISNTYLYGEYSDGNIRQQDLFSIMYGISPDWPWIWLGIGGEYLGYDEQVPDYYSPSIFKSTGLRFESNFPITRKLTASAAANADVVYEEDLKRGRGNYLALGLQYNFYKDYYLLLDGSVVNSYQYASAYREKDFSASIAGPLF